jgi:hypothetical protein
MKDPKCISCGSCGMPMKEPQDFALQNRASLYCSHCTDESGELLSYEQILAINAKYYMKSQGISESAALKLAADLLATKPAWKRGN